MATMDPQFTHGKLVEAASLLRLPVGVLVDSLGLAPDIFNTSSVTALRPPSPSSERVNNAMPSWAIGGRWPYPDTDQITSSDGSLLAFDAAAEHTNLSDSGVDWIPEATTALYPTKRLLSVSLRRDGLFPVSPRRTSPSPGLLAIHRVPSPKLSVSRRTSPGYGIPMPPRAIQTPTPHYGNPSHSPIKTEPANTLPSSAEWSRGTPSLPGQLANAELVRAQVSDATRTPQLGPCSKVWELPPRIRRRKKVKPDDRPVAKPKRDSREVARQGPKRRGPYNDETKKRNTALTRILKSCIRCRMNRGRCNPDPEDPYGSCLTCKGITGPTLCKMPCYRYIITDASLYREQRAPYQVFTRRWQSMDIINIPASDWASPETRTIVVSPNHIHAPFQFRVREFIPVEGDLLEEQWMTPHGMETVPTPRFAVADMHETAEAMKEYVERHMAIYIVDTVGHLDQLLWETYDAAFRQIFNAKTPEERSLMLNTFRLWLTCRMVSNPVHICGEDTLGGRAVYSENSLHNGKVPMPLMMTAQFECINYTTFLRPWSKAVLKQLNELVLAKKREYWLTIYFSMFVLLHSCAMITKRDEETARQYNIKTQYANPESIRAHHSGAQTMLAHFHFINKGVIPFSLPHNATGKQELAKAANLTDEQVDFVWRTARMVNEPERAARMRHARETGAVGDDLYWVSMLYDREWLPQGNS